MSVEEITVASAVIVPEELHQVAVAQATLPSPGRNDSLKRRPSSVSSTSSKRLRYSRDGPSNERPDRFSADFIVDRVPPQGSRRSQPTTTTEEKKRGQRLFGGLLGALSQSNASAAHRRRADIEKKQQAKLQSQAEVDEQARQQRLDKIHSIRQKQQAVWDKQTMRIGHSNTLAMAGHLKTKSQPALYYKPFELQSDQQEQISRQARLAEEAIDHELDDLDGGTPEDRTIEQTVEPQRAQSNISRRRRTEVTQSSGAGPAQVDNSAANGHGDGASLRHSDPTYGSTKLTIAGRPDITDASSSGTGGKYAIDDGGELVEGEEDTVIY